MTQINYIRRYINVMIFYFVRIEYSSQSRVYNQNMIARIELFPLILLCHITITASNLRHGAGFVSYYYFGDVQGPI